MDTRTSFTAGASLSDELGQLMHPLYQEANGSLKEGLLKPDSFENFKAFLLTQARLDQKSFRSPYAALLSSSKYDLPLKQAYLAVTSSQDNQDFHSIQLSVKGANESLLKSSTLQFEKELILIDPERYVSHSLGSKEGRGRLKEIFAKELYDTQTRHELIVALKSVGSKKLGDESVVQMDNAISWFENYVDAWVDTNELKQGTQGALTFLATYESKEEELSKQADRLSGSQLSSQVQRYQDLKKQVNPIPIVNDLKNKLIDLWMMAADDSMWAKCGLEFTEQKEVQRYILSRATDLLSQIPRIKSDSDLKALLQDYLTPLMEGSVDGSVVEHFLVGRGISDYLSDMPDQSKQAYLALKTTYEEIKTSAEMNVTLVKSQDDEGPRDDVTSEIITQLQSAQRQMWVGYKQHGFLSRGLTQLANKAGVDNDIRQIQRAVDFIDDLIGLCKGVEGRPSNPERIIEIVASRLYEAMQEDGVIMTALRDASSNEGMEACLSTLQFLAEGLVLGLASGGTALAAKAAQVGKMARAAKAGYQTSKIVTLNNGLEVATGGYREGSETALAWGKDAIASGASSMLTGGVPLMTSGVTGNLMTRFAGRYIPAASGFPRSVLTAGFHATGDMGVEIVEETVDQVLRGALDGETRALSTVKLKDTAISATAGGGFTKVGLIREMVKGKHQAPLQERGSLRDPAQNEAGQSGTRDAGIGAGGVSHHGVQETINDGFEPYNASLKSYIEVVGVRGNGQVGKQYLVRKFPGRSWIDKSPGSGLNGDPNFVVDILGAETARFFGYKKVDEDTFIMPDANFVNNAIQQYNSGLSEGHPERIDVGFYEPSTDKVSDKEYIENFLDGHRLPIASGGVEALHDTTYHALALALPPVYFDLLTRQAQERMRFKNVIMEDNPDILYLSFQSFLKNETEQDHSNPFLYKIVSNDLEADLARAIDKATGSVAPLLLRDKAEVSEGTADTFHSNGLSEGRSPLDALMYFFNHPTPLGSANNDFRSYLEAYIANRRLTTRDEGLDLGSPDTARALILDRVKLIQERVNQLEATPS